jgi:hypothetical protein
VLAAFRRDNGRGYLNCGTCEIRCWIEPEGKALMQSERNKVIC